MSILYIGPYRDGTGASKGSLNLISSLNETGENICIRPIKLNDFQGKLDEKFLELESKKIKGTDVIIQHVPPEMLIYEGEFQKNIAYVNYHTSDFKMSQWPERLNMMDEIWVPSNFVKRACEVSGIRKPIRVVPFGCDTSVFLQSYPAYKQIEQERHTDFLFYSISGSFSRRKNFGAFVQAFHLEFDKNEPVNIVIKFLLDTKNENINSRDFIKKLKDGLKLGQTKEEIVLPSEYLSDNEIYSIHNSCNVFVSTSYGEGFSIPCIDSMGFGKTPIVNGYGGYSDYIDDETGWKVDYNLTPVFGLQDNPAKLFYGKELWGSISIPHLRQCMREAYENHKKRELKSEAGINKVFDYSHEVIGSQIKRILYE